MFPLSQTEAGHDGLLGKCWPPHPLLNLFLGGLPQSLPSEVLPKASSFWDPKVKLCEGSLVFAEPRTDRRRWFWCFLVVFSVVAVVGVWCVGLGCLVWWWVLGLCFFLLWFFCFFFFGKPSFFFEALPFHSVRDYLQREDLTS